MKLNYYLLSFLVVVLSCTPTERNNNERDNTFSQFESRYVDHFPTEKLPVFHSVDLFSAEDFPHRGAFSRRTFEMNEDQINDLVNKFYLGDKTAIKHADYGCFICGSREVNDKYDDECSDSVSPIPTFYWLRKKLKSKEPFLEDDFNIYILESQSGKFLDPLLLTTFDCGIWSNGYSKGLIINRKKGLVTFWVEIW